jgi:hypothetical protein
VLSLEYVAVRKIQKICDCLFWLGLIFLSTNPWLGQQLKQLARRYPDSD